MEKVEIINERNITQEKWRQKLDIKEFE